MAATTASIDEFLSGPLVKWLSTCVRKPEALQVYETFLDGTPINEVLLQIDPEPSHQVPNTGSTQDISHAVARVKIFHCIVRNIKSIYEDELGQVVVSCPDCITLGKAPGSEAALEQLKLLILLLLGCAVQGPTKETFILKIKQLDVDDQHEIVECIKKVTDEQSVVLTSDWTEQSPERLYAHVRQLVAERDKVVRQWVEEMGRPEAGATPADGASRGAGAAANGGVDSNHLAVELADWKAKLRKLRQELEEKTELLTEVKDELEHANCLISKLKAENGDLVVEARRAKVYRDEMDSMRERLERIERLETEVQRYRERLTDAEFYRVRVDELREDNRVLMETSEMLEGQLSRARHRAERALQLEAELLATKQTINEMALERDAARERVQELMSENVQLQQVTKSALQETNGNADLDSEDGADNSSAANNSLSEQLTNSAQARALRLELENRKLTSMIDALKENCVLENADKILELEKEKKKLQLKCDQLQDARDRLSQQTQELENLFRNAIEENGKLQETLDVQKSVYDRQTSELQNERSKIQELENQLDLMTKEKQRLQALCDTIKNRADGAEKSLSQMTDEMENLHEHVEKAKTLEKQNSDLQNKIVTLEKEICTMQKEITKLKETLVAKDALLDQQSERCTRQEKDMQCLTEETESLKVQLEKFQDLEQRSQELLSQACMNGETIAALQKDLIMEKVRNEQIKTNLERLGIDTEVLEEDVAVIVERMLDNEDVFDKVVAVTKRRSKDQQTECESSTKEMVNAEIEKHCDRLSAEIASLQTANATLQNENVTLTVNVSTLQSQVNSLQTQQTALQLANSQLVAEKDELLKRQHAQNVQHDTLLRDQTTLRSLHEQLGAEYEQAKNEQENLKKVTRDLRSEIRGMREKNNSLQSRISSLDIEKDALKEEVKGLAHLKGEHVKLKDDFRNLFIASERMKQDYKAVQEQLRALKIESRNLRLGQTEMQGELNTRSDTMATLQLENAKLQQKCDMLFEMNHSLDSDRRALMDHVSQLLSQYHSLLTHSLEDKEHYHIEEKIYTDKLNNLCRQKEKLEEKIMDHYRKLENASSAKKKGFGATLVRRVRKAGSDIISKVPSRNRRTWHDDLTHSQANLTRDGSVAGGGDSNSEISGGEDDQSRMNSITMAASSPIHQRLSPAFRRHTPQGGSLHGIKPRDEVALLRRSVTGKESVPSPYRNSIAGDQVRTAELSGLGSVGSRRTVYLSEDDTVCAAGGTARLPPVDNVLEAAVTEDEPPPPLPPLLVYNRVSTTIGQPQESPFSKREDDAPEKETSEEKKPTKRETTIWYEYGCV